MERLNIFIQNAKKITAQGYTNVKNGYRLHVVLGNESADLDSVVSALVFAYHLKHTLTNQSDILPVINIPRKLLSARFLVTHLLEECEIHLEDLICCDEVELDHLTRTHDSLSIHLVDHHVLPEKQRFLESNVTQIIDHRPINTQVLCNYPKLDRITIEPVGSCATLITSLYILHHGIDSLRENQRLSRLLYYTILFDTINFREDLGRTSPLDNAVAVELERILDTSRNSQPRGHIFERLWELHTTTNNLSTIDILNRDVKILANGIAICALPMLCEHFLEKRRSDILQCIDQFTFDNDGPKCIILMGLERVDEAVRRDIAIHSKHPPLTEHIVNSLNTTQGRQLELIEKLADDYKDLNFILFEQQNILLTRKFVIPLLSAPLPS